MMTICTTYVIGRGVTFIGEIAWLLPVYLSILMVSLRRPKFALPLIYVGTIALLIRLLGAISGVLAPIDQLFLLSQTYDLFDLDYALLVWLYLIAMVAIILFHGSMLFRHARIHYFRWWGMNGTRRE